MTSTIDNSLYTSREIKKVSERINIKKVELNKFQNIKLNLYEDLKSNILTEEEYEEYLKEKIYIEQTLHNLKENLDELNLMLENLEDDKPKCYKENDF